VLHSGHLLAWPDCRKRMAVGVDVGPGSYWVAETSMQNQPFPIVRPAKQQFATARTCRWTLLRTEGATLSRSYSPQRVGRSSVPIHMRVSALPRLAMNRLRNSNANLVTNVAADRGKLGLTLTA